MSNNFLNKRIVPLMEKAASFTRQGIELSGAGEDVKLLISKILINGLKANKKIKKISDAEFKVFSQFGDDGIIQYLLTKIKILPSEEKFIEFGVETYRESNTRFLLTNNNWKGLVMDGNEGYVNSIKRWKDYWRYDLTARNSFITTKNINNLFIKNGFDKDIGLLSIDVDGNDYWVWEAITVIKPVIVIAEYNSIFGSKRAVSIPYDEKFYRTKAHYSNLYWGASLQALCHLAKKKGYVFIGSNSGGNNAYFVRNDRQGSLKSVSPETGYVETKYRESRDKKGNLTFLSGKDRLEMIKDLYVVDVIKNSKIKISELI